MKIFWSWQSDTLGKTGRHFVRKALEVAIEELREPSELEEPIEREVRDAIHLDQDRKGVSGSPDLARTILNKIDEAAVFIADVTPVAEILKAEEINKKILNPNVAIELGYALNALGDESVLMVLNEHYGSRDDLPFDLRHKAGPIIYNLPPEADKSQIIAEQKRLISVFKEAIKPYIKNNSDDNTVSEFREKPFKTHKCFYFDEGETLATIGEIEDGDIEYLYKKEKAFYLRLIPTKNLEEPLAVQELETAVKENLTSFNLDKIGGFVRRNKYGSIVFDSTSSSLNMIKSSTQAFRNGEV